jgi:F-type H+-transporting ATPase subunit b
MLFIYLLDFSPIKPDLGLILWTTIIFSLFYLLIGKFSYGPITNALKKRQGDIQDALDEAKKAKEEMAGLKAENEKLMAQAREERAIMLKEAKEAGSTIVNEAKDKAKSEAQKILSNTQMEIENQKRSAMLELKNEIGNMALDIAEKVIKKELKADSDQNTFVNQLVDDLKLN